MEALLKYLQFAPAYATDLAGLIASPKTFLANKNRGGDQDWANALIFFAISTIISFTIQATGVKLDADFVTDVIKTMLFLAIFTLTLAVVIKVAWRLVGGRAPLHSIILTQLYVFSIYMLISCVISLVFVSLHAIFYLNYYEEVTGITQKGLFNLIYKIINDPGTASLLSSEKYPGLIILGTVMFGIFCLVSVAWIIATWGAYRQLNEASRVRSFAAFILCGMLSVPTFGILLLLATATSIPNFKP